MRIIQPPAWVHRRWHRDKYRDCLICRAVWWQLYRYPRVRELSDEISRLARERQS